MGMPVEHKFDTLLREYFSQLYVVSQRFALAPMVDIGRVMNHEDTEKAGLAEAFEYARKACELRSPHFASG